MASADSRAKTFIAALNGRAHKHKVAGEGGFIDWRRFGEGPPVVLLHGGHGNWLHWARNIDALAGRHTVWVPDLPGFGGSDAPIAPTLGSLVDATQASLDTLVGAATPLAVVGFSFGGLVAASLAAVRPAVSRLALVGPGGHGGNRRPRGELISWRAAAELSDDAALSAAMRHNLLMHMLHEDDAVDALALHIHTDACLKTRFRSKPISRAGGLQRALERFDGPVLMAWGEHDVTAVPEEAASLLCRNPTRCKTTVVPGAGHWVQYERAKVINSLLPAWLDETKDMT